MIRADGLNKFFQSLHAVQDLDLNIAAGEIFGLVGPDGAGKTTTLRMLCGAIRVDSGRVEIAGYDLLQKTEQARAQIGYLPQRFSLYEELTVLENLRFFAEVRGLKAEKWMPRCMEILEFVGLDMYINRWAGKLSGGMKQKLGLAAALVHEPRVLLLDEPTTGVDPVTRQDFWQLIIRLAARGDVAVLITTPYMDEATRCTRLGFMKEGRLLIDGTPDQLREKLQGRVMELRGKPLPELRRLALRDPEVKDAQLLGDRIHLQVISGKQAELKQRLVGEILSAGGEVTFFQEVPAKLEDVFLSFSSGLTDV